MKKAMSNVDVAAMVDELRDRILGGHVGKAYQETADTIWLNVQSPEEGRLDLLMEGGRRVHITNRERPVSKTPPQFPTMLRGQLSGGRIADIQQFDFDRLLEISVERGGEMRYLIVELFPKGSLVLLDKDRKILTMLRKLIYRGHKMASGTDYLYHAAPGQKDPRTVTQGELMEMLAGSDRDLVRTIVRGLNMGGTYGEEVLFRAGVEKNKSAADVTPEEAERITLALREVFSMDALEPVVVFEDGEPRDVLPRPLQIYEGLDMKRYGTFSEALDTYFTAIEVHEEERQSPIDRRMEIQRKAVIDLEAQERELTGLGEMIYQRYGDVEGILKVISGAKEKGFTYAQIWERISGSDLPQARALKLLDPMGEMMVVLDGVELELNASLTVPQNAQRYYERAKEAAKKAAGAKEALEITAGLKEAKVAPKRISPRPVVRRRKPKWYERFRWFNSSDGFLVIGGRDAETNEEVYAKYLERRDLALHTDAPGAPLTVIKTEGDEVPEETLQEAAQFAVGYSSIWKSGAGSGDCYMVKGDQVSKTPEPGEFLRKGAFVIRGERRYFRDVPLDLAVGLADNVLIGGPVSAVIPKADPGIRIVPGEYNPDDLSKMIYRIFLEKVEDRVFLKSVASIDQIVQFLPPGGSRIKE